MKKNIFLMISAFILVACGSSGLEKAIKSAPSVAGSWKNLGAINSGNIISSYDTASLRKSGNLVWLRDRKIVINMAEERYVGTPRYKVAVSDWEFNCKNNSYRLTAVQFLDERGTILQQERYTSIPPMPISKGTIAEKQLAVACG